MNKAVRVGMTRLSDVNPRSFLNGVTIFGDVGSDADECRPPSRRVVRRRTRLRRRADRDFAPLLEGQGMSKFSLPSF